MARPLMARAKLSFGRLGMREGRTEGMETVSEVIVVLVTDFIFRGFSRHFGFAAD